MVAAVRWYEVDGGVIVQRQWFDCTATVVWRHITGVRVERRWRRRMNFRLDIICMAQFNIAI